MRIGQGCLADFAIPTCSISVERDAYNFPPGTSLQD